MLTTDVMPILQWWISSYAGRPLFALSPPLSPQTPQMRFFDDNTRSWWNPATGGAHVPGLNDLLAPFGLALGDAVVHGTTTLAGRGREEGVRRKGGFRAGLHRYGYVLAWGTRQP